jgi:hypothetical protein
MQARLDSTVLQAVGLHLGVVASLISLATFNEKQLLNEPCLLAFLASSSLTASFDNMFVRVLIISSRASSSSPIKPPARLR